MERGRKTGVTDELMSCATTGNYLSNLWVGVATTVGAPAPAPFLGHIIDLCFVCRCCALNCCHLSIAIHQFIKRLHSQFNDRPPGQTPSPTRTQPSSAQLGTESTDAIEWVFSALFANHHHHSFVSSWSRLYLSETPSSSCKLEVGRGLLGASSAVKCIAWHVGLPPLLLPLLLLFVVYFFRFPCFQSCFLWQHFYCPL